MTGLILMAKLFFLTQIYRTNMKDSSFTDKFILVSQGLKIKAVAKLAKRNIYIYIYISYSSFINDKLVQVSTLQTSFYIHKKIAIMN